MDETLIERDFALMNELKAETDALLSGTRSLWTQKKEAPWRAGAAQNTLKRSKSFSSKKGSQTNAGFTIFEDTENDNDLFGGVTTKKKKLRAKKKKKGEGRRAFSDLLNSVGNEADGREGGGLRRTKSGSAADMKEAILMSKAQHTSKHMRSSTAGSRRPTTAGPRPSTVASAAPTGVGKLDLDMSGPPARVTLEVYDDASPDNSPRLEDSSAKYAHDSRVLKKEAQQRLLPFASERERVLAGKDTFVPEADHLISAVDGIEREYQRLAALEDSARAGARQRAQEEMEWQANIAGNEAAMHLQRVARGRVGRKRAALKLKLGQMASENGNDPNPWIEVRDREQGESWFYNKASGLSQWERPDALIDHVPRRMTTSTSSATAQDSSEPERGGGKGSISVEENVTTKVIDPADLDTYLLENTDEKTKAVESNEQVTNELEALYGTRNIIQRDLLADPAGRFKASIASTVQNALLRTKFDSVASVMMDGNWVENRPKGPYPYIDDLPRKYRGPDLPPKDLSRRPLTAVSTLNQRRSEGIRVEKQRPSTGTFKPKQLQLRKVVHPGYEEALEEAERERRRKKRQVVRLAEDGERLDSDSDDSRSEATESVVAPEDICFGCWSQGKGKQCSMHKDPDEHISKSKTMLLCRNWDLHILRRRYRSEEIQEIFLKRSSSLKYDVKRKKFTTMVEARHMAYRGLRELLHGCNMRMQLVMKAKRWARSLLDEVRANKIISKPMAKFIARKLRLVRTVRQAGQVNRYSNANRPLMPIPPSTGYSHPERIGAIQYLFTVYDPSMGKEVEIIRVYPHPKPMQLYLPRLYFLPTPRAIPMPKPETPPEIATVRSTLNILIDGLSPASWLERISSRVALQAFTQATQQVEELTPPGHLTNLRRSKFPAPMSIKYASLGKKPTPGMMAVGGLAMEILCGELVSTYIPAQYGGFMVMDKASIAPGIAQEATVTFESLRMKPVAQPYTDRPLEHPLGARRHPTILLSSQVLPSDKHRFGTNRPEQTGETEHHGTRTSAWACALVVNAGTDTMKFAPGPGVASLNEPRSNITLTTHADLTYPFCEPSTRDNSTLDFYHLLLHGVFSSNHTQVFTALTTQEPGEFLRGANIDGELGHLVIMVYRSWGFKQHSKMQEFKTDEGVPYWYNRESGQTYWERPVTDEEKRSPLSGGTVLAPNKDHNEPPIIVSKGHEGTEPRYTQGQHRENMSYHIERDAEAMRRRKRVAASTTMARDKLREQGIDSFEHVSIAGNPGTNVSERSVGDEDQGGIQDPMSLAQEGSVLSGHTRVSTETSLVNDEGKQVPTLPPGDHRDLKGDAKDQIAVGKSTAELAASLQATPDPYMSQQHQGKEKSVTFVRGSALDGNSIHSVAEQMSGEEVRGMLQEQGVKGLTESRGSAALLKNGIGQVGNDTSVVELSKSLGQSLASMDLNNASTEDLIQVGLGMGMAIIEQNKRAAEEARQRAIEEASLGNRTKETHGSRMTVDSRVDGPPYKEEAFFPSVAEGSLERDSAIEQRGGAGGAYSGHPIGEANRTGEADKDTTKLDHAEEEMRIERANEEALRELNALERALEHKKKAAGNTISDPPDVVKEKIPTTELPASAEAAARPLIPILLYPHLSNMPENGFEKEVNTHGAAGDGTSFVTKEKRDSMEYVQTKKGEPTLRRANIPLPIGFFEKIVAKNIATQEVDYLPQIPNLPQPRDVGRVKPRMVAEDWLAVGFDPWSAGKRPLNTEFVSSLSSKASQFFQKELNPKEALDKMRESTMKDEYIEVMDVDGINKAVTAANADQVAANDFYTVSSLTRHGKFDDVVEMVGQPDWSLPTDYQDGAGNTLLHIAAQNGSKRLIKFLIRRGANLDMVNLSGQTALHFCFGYGYNDVGEWLVGRGADDSILNKDGLTCYEGLGRQELEQL